MPGNTLGAVVWSYKDVGDYSATQNGVFTSNKTLAIVTIGMPIDWNSDALKVFAQYSSTDFVRFLAYDKSNASANLNSSTATLIEIRVYP